MMINSLSQETGLDFEPKLAVAAESVGSPLPSNSRERFLSACHSKALDRPPIWLMRQAGRCLPEYRALKEKYSFTQLVQTPELAAEVTLQPIRRFGFDAAILFSDILVIPEALGQKYRFREQGGVEMDFPLTNKTDIERLQPELIYERLQYVSQALSILREELGEQTALLGFAGSPWTLANYMLEGGSAADFTRAKALFYSDPITFHKLMSKLSEAISLFLQAQIDAGVDAVQIFDSSGGLLEANRFEEASGMWMRKIIESLHQQVPVIVFSKGTHGNWDSLANTGAQVLGMDWTVNLSKVRSLLPSTIALQGNLDPFLLKTTPEIVVREASRLLNEMRDYPGHIFNLGHGVPPLAKLNCIEALVTTVKSFK